MAAGTFNRLFGLASAYKFRFFLASVTALLSSIAAIVPFVLIYLLLIELLNSYNSGSSFDESYVLRLAVASLIAVFLKFSMMGVSTTLSHIAAYNVLYDLRIQLARKLGSLSQGYFSKRNTGQIKKVLNEDVENAELFLAHSIPDILSSIFLTVIAAVYLFIIDWRLALATLSVIPISISVQALFIQGMQPILKDFYDQEERLNSALIEYVQGMAAIKIFNRAVESFSRYSNAVEDFQTFCNAFIRKMGLTWSLYNVLIKANLIVIIPLGAFLYWLDSITLPTYILFLLLGPGISIQFVKLTQQLGNLMGVLEGDKRISAIMDEPSLQEGAVSHPPKDFSVEFRDVSFAYEDKRVLDEISFQISPGSMTALVGPSGAGKTTIGRLIPRFWDISSGSICVGGIDIRDMTTESLMSHVSFVFQDTVLFNDTIYENIRLGNPNASPDDVIEVAKIAHCHEFISALPYGYQTVVGERGSTLSGGEKQRISIARAILKDAPIIILDEATSAIDPENEVLIQDALSMLIRNKTLLVIAHRLSTITDADEIVVLESGKVLAKGKHEELLQSSPLYSNMWMAHLATQSWTL
ncbi:MAG: ABC transporter ATP-binding protein [Cyanobacteria bacterium P01_F01_bin.150]